TCRTPARSRGGSEIEGRIVAEDATLEIPERGAGLESEVVGEHPPHGAVYLQRLRLPARPVEGEHELTAKARPERMADGQREHLVRVQREQRHQRALLGTREGNRPSGTAYLERPE